jgi:DNA-binding GntR family transcriptional regulator
VRRIEAAQRVGSGQALVARRYAVLRRGTDFAVQRARPCRPSRDYLRDAQARCSRQNPNRRLSNTHARSLPRHKAILTALLNRDPLAAQQATLVQLRETREDLSLILESGQKDLAV